MDQFMAITRKTAAETDQQHSIQHTQHHQLYELLTQHKSTYTISERINAVTVYASVGSLDETARQTGIEKSTLSGWAHNTDWWDVGLALARSRHYSELDGRLTQIIDRSLDRLGERIETGDFKYDSRSGELVQVPISAKDSAWIAAVMIDKRHTLRNYRVEQAQQTVHALADLARALKGDDCNKCAEADSKAISEEQDSGNSKA